MFGTQRCYAYYGLGRGETNAFLRVCLGFLAEIIFPNNIVLVVSFFWAIVRYIQLWV